MKVLDLIETKPQGFKGVFRAHPSDCKRSSRGQRYLRFGLFDDDRNVRAHAWEGSYQGINQVGKGDYVFVEGAITDYLGHPIAQIRRLESISREIGSLADGLSIDANLILRLDRLISGLSNSHLKQFCLVTLSGSGLFEKFTSFPASLNNHHRYVGGLLQHSLECAELVQRQEEFDGLVRDVGVVAALMHDLGKVLTQDTSWRNNNIGVEWDHDAFTVQVLSEPLEQLEQVCRDAAHALREIFSWIGLGAQRPVIPRYAISHAVIFADRLSAHRDAEIRAFQNHPHWHRFGEFSGRRYYRCLKPKNDGTVGEDITDNTENSKEEIYEV